CSQHFAEQYGAIKPAADEDRDRFGHTCWHGGQTKSGAKMVRPPSTGRHTPVTKSLSINENTGWAMFSGFPSRCTSVPRITRSRSSGGTVGGNITGPGRMQFTRTFGFRVPSSTARLRIIAGIAPFDGK